LIFGKRFAIIIIAIILYGINCYALVGMKTTNKPTSILKQSNPIEKALNWAKYELWTESSIGIEFNWGVEPSLW